MSRKSEIEKAAQAVIDRWASGDLAAAVRDLHDAMQLQPDVELYVLGVWGEVEPEMIGPFDTDEERITAAQKYLADNDGAESSVFRVDVTDGVPSTSSFTNHEMGT